MRQNKSPRNQPNKKDLSNSVSMPDLRITGRNIHISKSLKDFIHNKSLHLAPLSSLLTDIKIIINVKKDLTTIDLILRLKQKHVIKIEETSYNTYDAVTKAFHSSNHALKKHLQHKIHNEHHSPGQSEIEQHMQEKEDLEDLDSFYSSDDDLMNKNFLFVKDYVKRLPKISSRKKMKVKTLTQEEAIVHLKESSDPVIFFFGEEDHKFKLMYAQENGSIILIEPDDIKFHY